MKYKSILVLSLSAFLSIGILNGCGNKNSDTSNNNSSTAENKLQESGEDAKTAVEKGAESIKNGVEGIGDSIKYTAVNVKDDLTNAGYKIEDSLNTKKDYFKGTETDYLASNSLVRVYEFNSTEEADEAVAKISSDGLSINDESVYTTKPYYYRKGNTIVIYEGTDDTYVKEFNTLYGNPIL